ncbi:hypothetical protein PC123_g23700 [Phytophthora cactorum]|nr:hypothetical protein PC123_g23700 [Phytophthora cactorum]
MLKRNLRGIRGPHASPLLNKSPFHAIHQAGRAQDRWRADTAPEVQQRGNYIVLTPLRRSVSNIIVSIVYGLEDTRRLDFAGIACVARI